MKSHIVTSLICDGLVSGKAFTSKTTVVHIFVAEKWLDKVIDGMRVNSRIIVKKF